ncbi:hypothetical protein [Prosthecobacter sp.]|uniref:hypothetical protein n=1 Tax=Prosthecobacter sp. TaxID=1965333 RepID=UPI0037850243
MTSSFAITDFPDRLSPMVVKELRQGLRTRLFGGVMLILHLLLVLFTLMSGGAENAAAVSGWFDGIITLVLCIIIPLRGFSAVADELKAGTLDMLVLTRLSAGRIVFGKWAAIASQSLLIAFSVLPYVVARFVFGGLDLFEEIAVLFYKWVIGVVLAAVIVALSTQRQFWLRAVVIGLPLLIGGCGASFFFMMTRVTSGMSSVKTFSILTSAGGSAEKGAVLLALAMAVWAVFYFLSLAATRIAPASSLLSVVKRSVHLSTILLLILIGWLTSSGTALSLVSSGVLSLVMVDALTERVNEIPSVYAAFYRRGLLGRVALWLFAPGWVTGFVFTLLITWIVAMHVGLTRSFAEAQLVAISAASTWLIAVLVQLFSTRNARDLLPPFLIFWLIVSSLIYVIGSLLINARSVRGDTAWVACALPELLPIGYGNAAVGDKEAMLELGSWAALVWPVLLLILACLAWRHTRSARQEGWRMVHHDSQGGAVS